MSLAVRLSLALLATVLLVPPAAEAAPFTGEHWRPAIRAAKAYAARRQGTVSFALRTRKRLYAYDARRQMTSASLVKPMLLAAYLNRPGVRGRALRRPEGELLEQMIVRSANFAARDVYGIVGNRGLGRLAARVGMRDFATGSGWSRTLVTAADQTRLFLDIDRFVARRHRDTALRLLRSIVPRQRWGMAEVAPRGWAFYFKSAWTPRVQHQAALLRRGGRRLAISVLTSENPGPYYGRETERGVALRLLRGLRRDSVPR